MFTSVAKHLLLYRSHTRVLDRKYFTCIGGYVRTDCEVLLILSLVLHARLIAMVIFTVAILFSHISNLVFNFDILLTVHLDIFILILTNLMH